VVWASPAGPGQPGATESGRLCRQFERRERRHSNPRFTPVQIRSRARTDSNQRPPA
jgi:hypothetical protein